jgi:hypothetical protein
VQDTAATESEIRLMPGQQTQRWWVTEGPNAPQSFSLRPHDPCTEAVETLPPAERDLWEELEAEARARAEASALQSENGVLEFTAGVPVGTLMRQRPLAPMRRALVINCVSVLYDLVVAASFYFGGASHVALLAPFMCLLAAMQASAIGLLLWTSVGWCKSVLRVTSAGPTMRFPPGPLVSLSWDDISSIRATGTGDYRSLAIGVRDVDAVLARLPKKRRATARRILQMPAPSALQGLLAIQQATRLARRRCPAGPGTIYVQECLLGQSADAALARIAEYRSGVRCGA